MQGECRGERGDYRGSRLPGLAAGQGTAGGRDARRGRRGGGAPGPGGAAATLDVAGGWACPLSRVTLIDQPPVPPDLAADERVTAIQGDLGQLLDPLTSGPGTLSGADVVFHLAAAVSGECETDFDLGIRANLRATEALLASARAVGTSPVVVF